MNLPGKRVRLAVFGAYAGPLFVATHWPALTVSMEGRWDLLVHAAVFAVWNALLISVGFFGPILSPRNIAISTIVACAYAGLDEGLQAVPMVRRTAAWDDFGADILGACLGAGVAYVLGRWLRKSKAEGAR